jgi:hypothetical protein
MVDVPSALDDSLARAIELVHEGKIESALQLVRGGIQDQTLGPDQAWAFLTNLDVLEKATTREQALKAARADWKSGWNRLVIACGEALERARA